MRTRTMTLSQAAILLGDDVLTEFEARFDAYDEDEARDFAITHPQNVLHPCRACGQYRKHTRQCWLSDGPRQIAYRRQVLTDALAYTTKGTPK